MPSLAVQEASAPVVRLPKSSFYVPQGVRIVRQNVVGSLGFALIVLLILVALLASILAPFSATDSVAAPLQSPGAVNPLGTDQFGRDILSRIIFGSRISLYVGVIATSVALLGGTSLGLLAGYRRGWVDNLIMRCMEVVMAFPGLVLQIAIAGLLGPSLTNAMIAIGFASLPGFSRVARGPTLSVIEHDYVQAARVVGATDFRIIARYVLPNISAPIIVQASLSLSAAILAEAALSFLGLGTQPPDPSWGIMLSDGRAFMEIAPWIAVFPGLAIFLAVLGFNLAGDGLRDMLDPELRQS
jgi:peptide/nickel transport system permease protein